MNEYAPALTEIEAIASDLVAGEVRSAGLRAATDSEIADVLAVAGHVQRLIEAVLVDAVGEAHARERRESGDRRFSIALGCHDLPELIERTTLMSRAAAVRLHRAAKAVHPESSSLTGEVLQAPFPAVREAMVDGYAGVDSIIAITKPLLDTGRRVPHEAKRAAESVLADSARGEGPDGAPPMCADLLKIQALAWAAALDEDGAEPREHVQLRRRGVTLGMPTLAGVPIRGMLLPEVAAQFQRLCDALLSPKVAFDDPSAESGDDAADADEPVGPGGTNRDTRSRTQQLHDVLATALTVAAASADMPTIGGAAPTLVVSVRAEDLREGRGTGYADGLDQPVALSAIRQVACGGVTQRVTMTDAGRIVSIVTHDRVFNAAQRRAIALRDGGCIIPGCSVPAAWCEIHHVTEHSRGGPTHTDNGVLLCWWHHRNLDHSGWRIRMNGGIPEVWAPSRYDPQPRWRRTTTSPTRMRALARRSRHRLGIVRT